MKYLIIVFMALSSGTIYLYSEKNVEKLLLSKERAAMKRWNSGDPSGFLEIYADDMTYFEPQRLLRVDGVKEIRKIYESVRGQIFAHHFVMVNPIVQQKGDMAVLSYNLDSFSDEKVVGSKWNCTTVYSKIKGEWKVIHSHFSRTKEGKWKK